MTPFTADPAGAKACLQAAATQLQQAEAHLEDVSKLETAKTKVDDAVKKLAKGDNRSEAELFVEEIKDVRTRAKTLADEAQDIRLRVTTLATRLSST
jgi:hypothetical protein